MVVDTRILRLNRNEVGRFDGIIENVSECGKSAYSNLYFCGKQIGCEKDSLRGHPSEMFKCQLLHAQLGLIDINVSPKRGDGVHRFTKLKG